MGVGARGHELQVAAEPADRLLVVPRAHLSAACDQSREGVARVAREYVFQDRQRRLEATLPDRAVGLAQAVEDRDHVLGVVASPAGALRLGAGAQVAESGQL